MEFPGKNPGATPGSHNVGLRRDEPDGAGQAARILRVYDHDVIVHQGLAQTKSVLKDQPTQRLICSTWAFGFGGIK